MAEGKAASTGARDEAHTWQSQSSSRKRANSTNPPAQPQVNHWQKLYPQHAPTVELQRFGETASDTIELMETPFKDGYAQNVDIASASQAGTGLKTLDTIRKFIGRV